MWRWVIWIAACATFVAFCVGGWQLLDLSLSDDEGSPVNWSEAWIADGDLVVGYTGDTCQDERFARAEESPTTVVVTVYVNNGFELPLLYGCVTDGETFRIDLDEPVGDRAVYDGACLAAGVPDDECLRHPEEQL